MGSLLKRETRQKAVYFHQYYCGKGAGSRVGQGVPNRDMRVEFVCYVPKNLEIVKAAAFKGA